MIGAIAVGLLLIAAIMACRRLSIPWPWMPLVLAWPPFAEAIFGANIQMALDGGQSGGGWYAGSSLMLWLRLPVQPLLVWWAWTFYRDRSRREAGELRTAGKA